MARRRSPETIAFVGDIHAGSWWGLWPRDLLPERGFVGVRYLLDCWEDLLRRWPRRIDLLILSGDQAVVHLLGGELRAADLLGDEAAPAG